MELKCEGWIKNEIKMDDRYARQIQNDHREREPRNVPFIGKDGLPGGTYVVTVVVTGTEGAFLTD
jgi:hypothetical protein